MRSPRLKKMSWALIGFALGTGFDGSAWAQGGDTDTYETNMTIEGQAGPLGTAADAIDAAESDAWDNFYNYYTTLEQKYGRGNVEIRFRFDELDKHWHKGPQKYDPRLNNDGWNNVEDWPSFDWYAKWRIGVTIKVTTPAGSPVPASPPEPPGSSESSSESESPFVIPGPSAPSEDDDPVLIPDDESDLIPIDDQPESYDFEDEDYDLGGFFGGMLDGAFDAYPWP